MLKDWLNKRHKDVELTDIEKSLSAVKGLPKLATFADGLLLDLVKSEDRLWMLRLNKRFQEEVVQSSAPIFRKSVRKSIDEFLQKSGEGLSKGSKGDWRAEGYRIEAGKDSGGYWGATAYDRNSNVVGKASFKGYYIPNKLDTALVDHPDFIAEWGNHVHPDHQGKGLASAMYEHVEKVSGKKILPDGRTPEGVAFWNQPNRKFGNLSIHEKINAKPNIMNKDELEGGMADGKDPKDFDREQLVAGIKVEMEHTDDPHVALEIAMDHLSEDKDYYRKLKIMEESSLEEMQKNHKYIRKYKNDKGEWVYVYHKEGNQTPMSHEQFLRIQSQADAGDTQAKHLIDNIVHEGDQPKESPKEPAKESSNESPDEEPKAESPKKASKKPKESKPKEEAQSKQETPRTTVEEEESFLNARASIIKNVGEDVKGAARHARAMTVKELRSNDAEVKLKHLLEAEPINLLDSVHGDNPINPYICQCILERFPSEVKTPQDREVYLNAFEKVKELALKFAKPENAGVSQKDILKAVQQDLVAIIKDARANKKGSGNFLINYINSTLGLFPKRGSVSQDTYDYAVAVKGTGKDFIEFIRSEDGVRTTKDLIEGKHLSKIFGKEETKKGKKKFSVADSYTSDANRVGPKTALDSIESQTNFMTEKCGLRAIQWGNSVTDKERIHHLKFAAEALNDLSEVLKLPTNMVSFNGRLAFAIGARGSGNALAHYEKDKKIINLTRAKGVGSLAHEWGHFLDNVLSNTHNVNAHENNQYLSEASAWNLGEDSEVKKAMVGIVKSEAWEEFRKTTRDHLNVCHELGMDPGKSSYWLSPREMFARAFESYIKVKLQGLGRENTYLSGVNKGALFIPSDETNQKFETLFDKFFHALRESDHIKKMEEVLSDIMKADYPPLTPEQRQYFQHHDTLKHIIPEIHNMVAEVSASEAGQRSGIQVATKKGPYQNISTSSKSTFPEYYSRLSVTNREHFKKVAERQRGPIWERMCQEAHTRLIHGYRNQHNEDDPSPDYLTHASKHGMITPEDYQESMIRATGAPF